MPFLGEEALPVLCGLEASLLVPGQAGGRAAHAKQHTATRNFICSGLHSFPTCACPSVRTSCVCSREGTGCPRTRIRGGCGCWKPPVPSLSRQSFVPQDKRPFPSPMSLSSPPFLISALYPSGEITLLWVRAWSRGVFCPLLVPSDLTQSLECPQ